MADPAQSFRPREPGPEGSSLATIRSQLHQVRRRANAFALQHSLYVICGSTLVVLSLWIVLAFTLSRGTFAIVVWTTTVFELALVVGVLLRAQRRWIPRREASVAIDRRAGLEDRLATLSSVPDSAPPSRLWGFLVQENVRLLPFWTAKRFVPRAVPRSFWLFLVAFGLTAWVLSVSFPGSGLVLSAPGRPGDDGAGTGKDANEGEAEGAGSSSLLSSLPERIRSAILGRRSADTAGDGRAPGRLAGTGRSSDGKAVGGAVGGPLRKGNVAGSGGRLRSGPAEGEVAPPSDGGALSPPVGGAQERASIPMARQEPAKGEGPKSLRPVDGGKDRAPTRRADAKGGRSGQTSSKGSAGSGRGGDKGGLFGDAEPPGQAPGSFNLDLDARPSGDPGPLDAEPDTEGRPASNLSDEQRLDDAVRRAQVPAEYETIIQRVFNRAEEQATSPPAGR